MKEGQFPNLSAHWDHLGTFQRTHHSSYTGLFECQLLEAITGVSTVDAPQGIPATHRPGSHQPTGQAH